VSVPIERKQPGASAVLSFCGRHGVLNVSQSFPQYYGLQRSTLSNIAAPTTATTATACSSSVTVCTPATIGGTWANSAYHVGFV
jgi:hypothetical protein